MPGEAPRAPARRAIFVLGMHRSGTSAVTRMLNLLGCGIADELLEGDEFNERGYWEAPEIAELNDEILALAASSWNDWRALDPGWLDAPERAAFEDRIVELLHRQFDGDSVFVIKDPRVCRLFPIWRDAAERFGAEVCAVLPLRPPVEIAASLLRRNGMNPSIAQLVWLRHMLDAETHSRGRPRVVVRYDDLLGDWREVAREISGALALDWPRGPDEAGPEIDAFLSPGLRHHARADAGTLSGSSPIEAPWFEETMAILDSGARDAEARARLDRIRGDLDTASLAFGRPMEELARHGRHLKSLGERIAEERDAARAEARSLAETRDAARLEARLGRDKLASLHALFGEATRSLKHANEEARRRAAERDAAQARARSRRAKHDAARAQARSHREERDAAWARIEAVERELEDARLRLAAIERSASWRATAPYRRARDWQDRLGHRLAPTSLGRRLRRLGGRTAQALTRRSRSS